MPAPYHLSVPEVPTLIKIMDAFPKDSYYLINNFAREGESFTTEEVEIRTRKGHRPLAPYVSELLPGKVVARVGFTAQTWNPALLKPMRIITRHDVKVRTVTESLSNPKTPQQRYNELVTQDLGDLKDTVQRRKMQQLSEIMFTGLTTQIGEGVSQVLDWEFTNKEILSGANFSNDDFDVVGYFTDKIQEVMQGGGGTMRQVLTTHAVAKRIVTHPTVLKLIEARKEVLDVGDLNQSILPDGVIYHGTLRQVGLRIFSYTNAYTDENGQEVDYIPAGTLALLPDGQSFEFLYGANLVADENGNFYLDDTKVLPQVWGEMEPPKRVLQLLSKPLCVPDNINGWYVAKVM